MIEPKLKANSAGLFRPDWVSSAELYASEKWSNHPGGQVSINSHVVLTSDELKFKCLPIGFEPHNENETKCKAFHMKVSFVCT